MRRLSGWDAFLLYAETETIHMHTLKVAIADPEDADPPATFEHVRDKLAVVLPRLAPFRFRLREVPFGLHRPMWSEDPSIDVEQHFFHLTAPAPGRRGELDRMIGEIASTKLDRRRPLWTVHYIDGLTGGRVALVVKVHHALADGMASANILAQIFSSEPTGPSMAIPDSETPTQSEILRAAIRDHAHGIRRLPGLVFRTIRSVRRLRRASDVYAPHDLRILNAPGTFLNRPLSPQRAFGTAVMSLPTVKRIGTEVDATINDILLALVSGALRELFLLRDEELTKVVASVPVSTNRDPDRMFGNHLAGFLVTLPLDEPDPIKRLRRVQQSAEAAKRRFELLDSNLYDDWVEYLPPKPSAAILRFLSSGGLSRHNPIFNIPVSTVPGPRSRGCVAGMPVLEIYSVGPVMDRAAVNVTIWSYNGRLGVGVITDAAVVPEAGQFAEMVHRSLADLHEALELGDSHELAVVGWDAA